MSYGSASVPVRILRREARSGRSGSSCRWAKRASVKQLRLSWRRLGEWAATRYRYRPYYN